MVSCWAVLLLLLSVATAVPVQPPQPYEKAIARAIDFYNQGPTPSASLQPPLCLKCSNLLRATGPTPLINLSSAQSTVSNTLQLNFTIMETTCSASDKAPVEQCAFKENGLVRDCSGLFSTQEACPVLAITCNVAPPQAQKSSVMAFPFSTQRINPEIEEGNASLADLPVTHAGSLPGIKAQVRTALGIALLLVA
uniref:Cathelicidin family antimicrobial peptide CATH4 n=1 Tax=Chelonia mydas TaxID=8469 RepID=A0A8K0YBG1_CHEMY|nr:cathelicidin family antimicrobial peptide CATH4 precursor [Chelonia mydas]